MKINEVSKITGVSLRTLHYYDKIGLLVPAKLENGYRVYSNDDLNKLQKILFYKYLNFKLSDIANIIKNKNDSLIILEEQHKLLLKEKKKIENVIKTIEKTIKDYKGEIHMTIEEKFEGFKKEDMKKYEIEAKDKYGEEIVEESNRRQKGQESKAEDDFNNTFKAFAKYKKEELDITSEIVQKEVEKLYNHINKYGFDCSLEVFSYIGKGYYENQEFRNNINKFGEDVAEYISSSIKYYCNKNR
ncbi:MerR family transcriptional regulator [Gemella sanguinis]|uniref:MerR family transcriptional regulator n=1 Tax=Gemella sanguinis TaxID=84135 RepID=UPI00352EF502